MPQSGREGGPGAFPNAFKSVTHVHRPAYQSTSFLAAMDPGMFPDLPESEFAWEQVKPFSQTHQRGPTFPKGGSDAQGAKAKRNKEKVKVIYPKFAEKIWPSPKVIEKIDPFKHLKALKK